MGIRTKHTIELVTAWWFVLCFAAVSHGQPAADGDWQSKWHGAAEANFDIVHYFDRRAREKVRQLRERHSPKEFVENAGKIRKSLAATDPFGQGELTDTPGWNEYHGCGAMAYLLTTGQSLLGLIMASHAVELSYLGSRSDVDCGQLVMMGGSMGGTHALWLTAIDERIKAAVPVSAAPAVDPSWNLRMHCLCDSMVGAYRVADGGRDGRSAALAAARFGVGKGGADGLAGWPQAERLPWPYRIREASDRGAGGPTARATGGCGRSAAPRRETETACERSLGRPPGPGPGESCQARRPLDRRSPGLTT
jgi:hypothetical protein